jgi:hypothetical protein
MSGLADATKCEKCGRPWSQAFEAFQNDADVNVIAAPHQELFGMESCAVCDKGGVH